MTSHEEFVETMRQVVASHHLPAKRDCYGCQRLRKLVVAFHNNNCAGCSGGCANRIKFLRDCGLEETP